jgi:hypothetical protein
MKLEVSPAALAALAKVGFDPVFGARPLKRAIQQRIENPVSKLILQGRFGPKDVIHDRARGHAQRPRHLPRRLITTLADSAFAFACNAYNELTVASGFDVDLLAPGAAGRRAHRHLHRGVQGRPHRRLRHRGRNQNGERIAVFRGRSYTLKGKPVVAGCPDKEQDPMPVKQPAPGDLEPIETASRDELQALQLQRLKCTRCSTPTTTCRTTASAFDAAGVHPSDCKSLADLAKFPFTTKATCATTTPSACSRCRASRWCACTPRRAPPASRRWWATRKRHRHLGRPGGALDPRRRRPAGDMVHVAYGYGLFTGGLGAHYGAERWAAPWCRWRRPDREAGAADHRLRARHHHGHAQLHAGDRRGDASARAWTRARAR